MCFVDTMNDDGHRTESLGCSVPWTMCPDPGPHTVLEFYSNLWGIGTELSYRPASLCSLAGPIPTQFLAPIGCSTGRGRHCQPDTWTSSVGGDELDLPDLRHGGIKRRRPSRKIFQHLDRNQRGFKVGITEGKTILTTICKQKNKREY
jgi:hypothetical protein